MSATTDSTGKVVRRYNSLVARDGHTFYFLRRVFFDPDRQWSGAVGSRMTPVTEDEYQRRLGQLKDYEWSAFAHIYDEQNPPVSWDEWIASQIDGSEPEVVIDPSHVSQFGETVRERTADELPITADYVECVGGGRCFYPGRWDFDVVYDRDLLRMIADTERSEVPDWASHYV